MESQALRSAVRRLRHVVAPAVPVAGSDAELLRGFVVRKDAAAFEQIVRRHGPMVLGVCRRVLRDPADADDAFQATFLVLVRKAGSLRAPDRLAGWLHQVAHRVARKARAVRLNRARREGELFDVPAGEPPAEIIWRELRPIFDAELDRLPDRLRLPAVLCLLEGQSKREAARTLGWAEGTLSCRLQRARERLRARLAARGLTLSAGALAAALFEGAGTAAVPDRLIALTVQGLCAPAAAAGARALADGITQAMFLTKVKALAAGVLVAGAVGTGTGVVLMPGAAPGEVVAGEPAKGAPEKEPKPVTQSEKAKTEAPTRAALKVELQGLRDEVLRLRPLVQKGTYPKAEWEALLAKMRLLELDLNKQAADTDRAIKAQELELLKERLAFEEQMVKKGYMTEAQVKLTRLKVAKAEAELARPDPPKVEDPRRAAAEEVIRKLEQIVEQTRQGVARGIIPQQELLNSEATLARYKFELLALDRRPAAAPPVSAEQRAALEAVIHKMEEIVAQTAEGVKRGIIPQQELLNVQAKVLEHRFKLIELTGDRAEPAKKDDRPKPADPRRAFLESAIATQEDIVRQVRTGVARGIVPTSELIQTEYLLHELKVKLHELPDQPADEARTRAAAAERQAMIALKERELGRAEENSLNRRLVSAEEITQLRVDLGRLKADAATASGDHATAVKLREGVVTELEAVAALARVRVERKTAPRSELRAAELAVAEARVEILRAGIRRQLAEIVAARELDVKAARAAHERGVIPAVQVQQAEVRLAEAKARLATER